MLPALQSHSLLHINVAPNYMNKDMIFASEFIWRSVGEKFCKGTTLLLQVIYNPDISPCS